MCTMALASTAELGAAADAGNIPVHCEALYVVDTLAKVLSDVVHA
jgi:hypothetical protein